MIAIRPEERTDATGVREVNIRAFDGQAEADLVDQLRDTYEDVISLVAEDQDQLVGHILFSPVAIETESRRTIGMGLAPMAVLPEFQRTGIGSKLVETGLDTVRAAGYSCVVVLGHPEYYPRFGFEPASNRGVSCEFAVPDEVFMILVLDEDMAKHTSGVAKYRTEFDVWK